VVRGEEPLFAQIEMVVCPAVEQQAAEKPERCDEQRDVEGGRGAILMDVAGVARQR
jgi:hypothetical protein